MNRYHINHLGLAATFLSLLAAVPSCVKEEYDLTQLDTTIQFGGDSLALPLGSTQKLFISKLLGEEQKEFIKELENGVYGFNMHDTFDFSDQIPDLSKELQIDPVKLDNNFKVEVGQIDLSNMKVDEINMNSSITFDQVNIPDVQIPPVSFNNTVSTEISKYKPSAEQLAFTFPDVAMHNEWKVDRNLFPGIDKPLPPGVTLPALPVNNLSFTLPATESNVHIALTLPEGVSNIRDIVFNDGAQIKVELALTNAILTKGAITPDITLDFSQLLKLGNADGKVVLGAESALTVANGFKAPVKNIPLAGLADLPWKGNQLDVNVPISLGGSIKAEGESDVSALKAFFNEKGGKMNIDVKISFVNVAIKDVTMDIDPLSQTVEQNVELAIDPIQLPEMVAGIDNVKMSAGSKISLSLNGSNFSNLSGITAQMNGFTLTFPKEIEAEGLVDGQMTVDPFDLKSSKNIDVNVLALRPAAPVNGQILFNSQLSVKAQLVLGGTIKLSQFPASKAQNPAVAISASSTLAVDDFSVIFNRYEQAIDPIVENISVDLPKEIGDFGTLSVVPNGNPKISISITRNTISTVDLLAGGQGLVIHFPEMLSFKDINPAYNYNAKDNSITIKGVLPDNIVMNVDKLTITPVADENGNLKANGEFNFSGSAILGPDGAESAVVSGNEIKDFLKAGIQIDAKVDALTAKNVSLETFSKDIEQTQKFDVINLADLPKELVSLNKVELKDTKLSLDLDVKGLPDMGAVPHVALEVSLPKEIHLKDQRVDKNNVLRIEGDITDKGIKVAPIAIDYLDMSNVKLDGKGTFSAELFIKGKISVDKPTVRPEDLQNLVVDVNITGGIPQIQIVKATGKVGYTFEDMGQSIELTGLPDFVKDDNFKIDLVRPYITLNVKSNVGLPVKGDIEIVPYYGTAAGKSLVIEGLSIPAAKSAKETLETKLYLAGDSKTMPEGYTFLKADLRSLLKKIPDKLDLKINAGTDVTSKEDHIVEPYEKYQMALDYDVTIPFEFGEDLDITFADTLDVSANAEIISSILKDNKLKLFGEIESNLPLQLELSLKLMDSQEMVIPTEEVSQIISACKADGSSNITKLDLLVALKKGTTNINDLKFVQMNFRATSADVPGVPVTTESFVQAKIKFLAPGGITLDPIDLTTNTK